MSRFELKTVSPHCGPGSVVAVDGRDITASVRAVTITASPDGSHAEVQLRPTAFDLVVEARVVLHVTPAPGYVVISEPQPDGSVRHRCEPERPEGPG